MSEMVVQDEAWRDEAACRDHDPDWFFARPPDTADAAKQVCRGCPVAAECLEYALAHGIRFGVWGGMSEKQRKQLRAERARAWGAA